MGGARRSAPLLGLVLLAASCGGGPSPDDARKQLSALKQSGRIDDVSETNFVYCAFMGDLPSVRLYLASGMSPNARSSIQRTPLMGVASFDPSSPWSGDAPKVAQLLLEHGADVSLRDSDGKTALSFAKDAGHDEIARLLEGAGAKD
jgi:ankyrin repeat protein